MSRPRWLTLVTASHDDSGSEACPPWCQTGDPDWHDFWEGLHHKVWSVPVPKYARADDPGDVEIAQYLLDLGLSRIAAGELNMMLAQEPGEPEPSILLDIPPAALGEPFLHLTVAQASQIAAALTEICETVAPRPVIHLHPAGNPDPGDPEPA